MAVRLQLPQSLRSRHRLFFPILRRLMWGLLELTELLIAHMGDRFRK